MPGARAVGVIGKETDEQRIATIPSSGGVLSYLSPPDTYVYEYQWLPAGAGFVATAAKGDGDSNWWVAKLVVVDRSGATRTLVTPTFQITQPVVSPDGRTVLFIGGLMSDFTVVGGDLYSVPTAGGAHTNLTRDASFTVNSLTWTAPDPLVTTQRAEHLDIARVDLGASGRLVRVWSGMVSAAARDGRISVSRDGLRVASMLERFDSPPAIAGIKKAKTPTLRYVGEFDVETPAAQSLEFWHGLRAMDVPTELVIYEGEGHVLRKPEYIHDVERRTVEWFDRHLSP